MLRGLGLQLVGRAEVRQQREVDEHDVLVADVVAHLTNRFEERQRLDVADRAADLDDARRRRRSSRRRGVIVRFDLVGDVRDDLDRRAEVVAAPLLFDDRLVDLTGRDVVDAA